MMVLNYRSAVLKPRSPLQTKIRYNMAKKGLHQEIMCSHDNLKQTNLRLQCRFIDNIYICHGRNSNLEEFQILPDLTFYHPSRNSNLVEFVILQIGLSTNLK